MQQLRARAACQRASFQGSACDWALLPCAGGRAAVRRPAASLPPSVTYPTLRRLTHPPSQPHAPPPATLCRPSPRIPFHRKAQALASDLYARFGTAEGQQQQQQQQAQGAGAEAGADPRFAFEDAAELAGDSGAAAAAAWAALGVAKLPERLAQAAAEGAPLTGEDEALVRAVAVAAADAVAAAAGGGLSAAQVGAWAAGLLEDGGELHGKAKGHVTPGTVAY
jgi:hypothetical protein